jgi:NAD(P)-dependent dehydrogenase (short-subunit alcohol dehydrogenase family)
MENSFRNETVVISGGLGDIGRAMALAFAECGANIALCDILEPAQSRDFLSVIEAYNVKTDYARVDVSDAEAVANWIASVEGKLGLPTIIIANAAIVHFTTIHELTAAQWSQEIGVNLNGAFHLAQAATARLLYHKRSGRVVFIGSWAAHSVHTHIPAYCVSKAGMRMLCKCLALELAPHNILVNEVAPGYVDAGLSGRTFEKSPQIRKEAEEKVPVKRLITAAEVAQQVLHLCHPSNQHMTGSTILMDGGLSLLT